ncbi:MAG: C39 family peptidase [Prosthecobacter sp.]
MSQRVSTLLQILVLAVTLITKSPAAELPVVSLDPLIDWQAPLSMTRAEMGAAFKINGVAGAATYWFQNDTRAKSKITTLKFKSMETGGVGQWQWSPSKLPVENATVYFENDQMNSVVLRFSNNFENHHSLQDLIAAITLATGSLAPDYGDVVFGYEPNSPRQTTARWSVVDAFLDLRLQRDGGLILALYRSKQGGNPLVPSEKVLGSIKKNFLDLDSLLDFSTIWQTDTAAFEQRYIPKTEGTEPPQDIPAPAQADAPTEKPRKLYDFEWLAVTKERARFSRQKGSDFQTIPSLFDGRVIVEEAIVELVKGKVARSTISIYNRGDAGDIGSIEFDSLFKKIGLSLSGALKVVPKRQLGAGNAAVKIVSWIWTTPSGIAILEHNDFQSDKMVRQPEFLRLKLSAPDQAGWSMGKLNMGVQRMTLQKNVTKTPDGDVYISGVPMVDQGAKGYCVAASCQRLFEYLQIPCDQHEMAQILNADAETGVNVPIMLKSLAKVDQQFGVSFKPLINPKLYYDGSGKRRVSIKEFASIIREHVDKGIPLLWGLEIGRFPETPPLPNAGQIGGGHMRMLIGYSSSKDEVIFTDSWGAGHEIKRMTAADAYAVTLGVFTMSPRGL